jgi:hypothetical protein
MAECIWIDVAAEEQIGCPGPLIETMAETHCNGLDEDCDGSDFILDAWDASADNGTCMTATRINDAVANALAPEAGARNSPPFTVTAANHDIGDLDYFEIDVNLLTSLPGNTGQLTVRSGAGVQRIVEAFTSLENCNAHQAEPSNIVFRGMEEESTREIFFASVPRSVVYVRVQSFQNDATCADEYSFVLDAPGSALVTEMIGNRGG